MVVKIAIKRKAKTHRILFTYRYYYDSKAPIFFEKIA